MYELGIMLLFISLSLMEAGIASIIAGFWTGEREAYFPPGILLALLGALMTAYVLVSPLWLKHFSLGGLAGYAALMAAMVAGMGFVPWMLVQVEARRSSKNVRLFIAAVLAETVLIALICLMHPQ